MLDPAISEYFNGRKEAWLKKNIKASMTEIEVREKQQECEHLFSLENWLPNAAKRAGQISISTHPCTYSHPSARKNNNGYVTSVLANGEPRADGFLRTGNVNVEPDALGNAAALDVYKFLTLNMQDGESLLSHIKRDSELAESLLTIKTSRYSELKEGFLAMVTHSGENITSSKIKQVYFPVEEGYHLLSVLTPSPIVFELKKRIDHTRFSEETKEARECRKKNEPHEQGYCDIPNITTIGYGGTKPQNISVLNNQNGGKAYLLSSLPPKLKKHEVVFPRGDFFVQSISHYLFYEQYTSLHNIYSRYKNNIEVRSERDTYYQEIIDRIIDVLWAVRGVSVDQYSEDTSQLPGYQKIWLCSDRIETREETEDWLDSLIKALADNLFRYYEKCLGKKAIKFGDAEYMHVRDLVNNNREALR